MEVSFGSGSDLVSFSASSLGDRFAMLGENSLIDFEFHTLGTSAFAINTIHGLCCTGKITGDSFDITNRNSENVKINYIVAGKIGSISIEPRGSETLQIGSTNEVILFFW